MFSWDFPLLVLGLILIPTAYGGIHLSALHEMFPTAIERALWKASCFTLIGFTGSALLLIGSLAAPVIKYDLDSARAKRARSSSTGLRGSMRAPAWAGYKWYEVLFLGLLWISFGLLLADIILCFAARIFVVVESFISLRHVPIGVYQTPPTNFMGYIPHL